MCVEISITVFISFLLLHLKCEPKPFFRESKTMIMIMIGIYTVTSTKSTSLLIVIF